MTKDGERHLIALVGTERFRENFVKGKIKGCICEIKMLDNTTKTEPKTAYMAFIYGVKLMWDHVIRTVLNISTL